MPYFINTLTYYVVDNSIVLVVVLVLDRFRLGFRERGPFSACGGSLRTRTIRLIIHFVLCRTKYVSGLMKRCT